MEKHIGKIIGVVFGVLLVVVGIVRPAFAWDYSAVASIRSTLGDTLSSIFLVGAGVVVALMALLTTKK